MCAAFSEYARGRGWIVHPETSGYDLVLVAGRDVRGATPGDQIAVEAKLHDNIQVLFQALPVCRNGQGPAFFGVLVPRPSYEFLVLALRLGISVFHGQTRRNKNAPWEPRCSGLEQLSARRRWVFDAPLWTPDVVVDVPAGVPSPLTTTPWKVNAVRFCLLVKNQMKNKVTSAEFADNGISMTSWRKFGWIEDTGKKAGRRKIYRITDKAPHIKWPHVTEALEKHPLGN